MAEGPRSRRRPCCFIISVGTGREKNETKKEDKKAWGICSIKSATSEDPREPVGSDPPPEGGPTVKRRPGQAGGGTPAEGCRRGSRGTHRSCPHVNVCGTNRCGCTNCHGPIARSIVAAILGWPNNRVFPIFSFCRMSTCKSSHTATLFVTQNKNGQGLMKNYLMYLLFNGLVTAFFRREILESNAILQKKYRL